MPDQDTASALGAASEQVKRQVVMNKDLVNNFKAALAVIADTAAARGKRLEGIETGEVTMTENRIRVKINFPSAIFKTRREMSPDADSLTEKIAKDEYLLWVFLRANPALPDMLKGIIMKMDAYARDKGSKFQDLKIINGIMDHEDYLVLFLENPRIGALKP